MSKTLKAFIIVIFVLGIASLTLGVMLFEQREILKGRTQVLEEATMNVARGLRYEDIRREQIKDLATMRDPLQRLWQHGDSTYVELQDTKQDLARTRVELAETQQQLELTRQDLAAARSRISDLEGQLAQKEQELSDAMGRIARLEEEKDGLLAQITTLETTIADTQEAMAELNDELRLVKEDNIKLSAIIGSATGGDTPIGLTAEILSVKPEWNFVVINKGFNDKLSNGTRLLVHRGDQFLGMVTVSNVEESMATADIMRDWLKGDFQPGDKVLYEIIATDPASQPAQPAQPSQS